MKRDISRPTYIVCSQEFYIGHSLTIVSKLFYVRSISIQDATWLLCHTYEPNIEVCGDLYSILWYFCKTRCNLQISIFGAVYHVNVLLSLLLYVLELITFKDSHSLNYFI